MKKAKSAVAPMESNLKLSLVDAPETEEDKQYMSTVPYTYVVGSLMYAMVYTHPDLHILLVWLVDT